ncbi:MAG: nucleotide exchange factor GrpE [Defluviitaleaceae bacterium]|nr:nucleotide exchange factor GrpE [Defluviitaleaceae bacterium]MCL2263847.1 nucleotide exchange factor GrpE [Defluviitaleaceae bacterium]
MKVRLKAKRENSTELWALWEKYKAVAANDHGVDKRFAALSKAVCGQITTDAARFSRLGESDEEIYAHLVSIMGVYKRVIGLAEGISFDDENVNALVEGICEVLKSRLREFDDAAEEPSRCPIKTEKSKILNEALANTMGLIDSAKENYEKGLQSDDSLMEELYSFYSEGLRFCLSRLDDLHSRKTARFYTELIEREYEEIGNIIKLPRTAAPAGDAQAIAVSGILDALNEAQQATEPIIKNFQMLQSEPQKKAEPVRSFEDFENELDSLLETTFPQPPERENFFAALEAEAAGLAEDMDVEYTRADYSLQKLINAEVLLAKEITGVFSQALEKLTIDADGMERDILNGIRETIEIKISGLQESIQTFSGQSGDILKKFQEEKSDTPEDENKAILAAVRAAWLETPPQEESALAEFFDTFQNSEAFAPCRERVKTQVDRYTAMLEKASLRFKKEVLLYEVCTFEEILTHSVSRLRDSSNAAVSAAAAMLDDTFRNLEVILKKNNIAVIRPAVKEIFNAKEHEVIVAEKQDGFEKGEIIKIVTAGYRLKEQVILRANIIAAR